MSYLESCTKPTKFSVLLFNERRLVQHKVGRWVVFGLCLCFLFFLFFLRCVSRVCCLSCLAVGVKLFVHLLRWMPRLIICCFRSKLIVYLKCCVYSICWVLIDFIVFWKHWVKRLYCCMTNWDVGGVCSMHMVRSWGYCRAIVRRSNLNKVNNRKNRKKK